MKGRGRRTPEVFQITDDLWNRMMEEVLQRSLRLLDSAKTLFTAGGDEAICAGLYTYAVEEYGKFFVLKHSHRKDKKVTIQYSEEFINHREKFDIALNKLPTPCTNLGDFEFEQGFERVQGTGFEKERTISNFKSRMGVFYTDFTDMRNEIKPVPPVNKNNLKKAIDKLQQIVLDAS